MHPNSFKNRLRAVVQDKNLIFARDKQRASKKFIKACLDKQLSSQNIQIQQAIGALKQISR